eukprot:SAG11_NODE_1728_length_4367_cov_4.915183_2_plen_138_part_00
MLSANCSSDMEVFAADVGVGKAVGNTVANAPGAIIPALGVLLRQRFGGSWIPLMALIGSFQLMSGLLYATFASVEPAAELLDRRRELQALRRRQGTLLRQGHQVVRSARPAGPRAPAVSWGRPWLHSLSKEMRLSCC